MARTILLVEDDFDTQYPFAELLQLKGYTVLTASNAEVALQKARDFHPDLIVTDIVLPGKSGLQLIYNVRSDETIETTPIMVVSGCEPSILADAKSLGANFCLPKPIHLDDFWDAFGKVFKDAYKEPFVWQIEKYNDTNASTAVTIDNLLHQLDDCSSEDEKGVVLKRLKEQILNQQKIA
jgi:DNA-binding response OmpR family regulator